MSRTRGIVLALALCSASLFLAPAAAAPGRGSPCLARFDVRDVKAKYGTGSDDGLDLYLPEGRPAPRLIVFVHGGGWRTGNRAGYEPLGDAFASCGIAVATLDYTLAPKARADAMARQIARAIAWLEHDAATYGYASAPVFLVGHSAGAQLVAYVATPGTNALASAGVEPASIGGAVLLDGLFYDPASAPQSSQIASELGPVFGDSTTWHERYALRPRLTGSEAPMLVVHGTADTLVPADASEEFYDALLAAGDRAEYLQPPGLSHDEVMSQLFSQRTDLFERVVDFVGSGALSASPDAGGRSARARF